MMANVYFYLLLKHLISCLALHLLVESDQVVKIFALYLYLKSFCWFLAISICSSELNLTLAAVNAASNIHKSLLNNVFRQPMQFFDIAPVGRILCRFSTDVCTVDQELSFNVYEVIESGCVVCHINTLMAVIFKLYDNFLSFVWSFCMILFWGMFQKLSFYFVMV